MSLQFYKPNAKSTGTACSFWRNSEDNTFWVSLIKQDSWNAKTRTGSFSKNKDNPQPIDSENLEAVKNVQSMPKSAGVLQGGDPQKKSELDVSWDRILKAGNAGRLL